MGPVKYLNLSPPDLKTKGPIEPTIKIRIRYLPTLIYMNTFNYFTNPTPNKGKKKAEK